MEELWVVLAYKTEDGDTLLVETCWLKPVVNIVARFQDSVPVVDRLRFFHRRNHHVAY